MKQKHVTALLLLLLTTSIRAQAVFEYQNPISSGIDTLGIRDCHVFRDGDSWYMTGTAYPFWRRQEENGLPLNAGVPLYRSNDLLHWQFIDYIVRRPSADKWYYRNFWAPEIRHIKGKYYCTFNCANADAGYKGIFCGYAVSDALTGPYRVVTEEKPLSQGNDLTLFEEEDGTVWAFWNRGSDVGIIQSRIDLEAGRLLDEPKVVIPCGGKGEWDHIGIEGSCVFKRGGIYYLLYSSWTRGYEIGCATAPTINGPWTKCTENPIYGAQDPEICRKRGLVAEVVEGSPFTQVGHNQVFIGPTGDYWLSCHGNLKTDPEHPMLVIDPLTFRSDGQVARMIPSFTKQTITINAQWISTKGDKGESLPVFTKTVELKSQPRNAMLQATALGIYDVTINGQYVGQHELKPGWTDYRKEVTYQTMDVTPLLRKGKNTIHVQLSRGWWAGGISRKVYGDNPPLALMARLVVDGQCIAQTDGSWQYSVTGPLLEGDIYNGETYDARRQPTDWQPVAVIDTMRMAVVPFEGPEVRIRDERLWRHPQTVTIYHDTITTGTTFGQIKVDRTLGNEPFVLHKGETAVVDLGQNMVGWMLFEAKAKRGTTLTMRHGEMLNYNGDQKGRLDDGPGGSVWTYNLREAKARLQYTFRGDRKGETYHPSHTFMGFRYVSITATDDVEITKLTGQVVGSDIQEWGEFECSDSSINQLYHNIWWGQRGNFLSVPTDCPQRNERLGWTGDTQIFSRTALYQSDAGDFYRKWMRDMRNSQCEDGAYPDIAPYPNFWGYGTAAWGDAGVIVPWNVYEMTGDKTILTENYESMTRWMQWLATQQEEGYRHIGGRTATGDWLAYDPLDRRYVSVAYYAYVAQLMDSISTALGKSEQARHYRQLYQDIRQEFQQRYMTADGQLAKTTQTAYLLALRLELLPEEYRQAARDSLRMKIEQNDYCLSTGFVGTGLLCPVLSDEDMDDLAYALLLQRKNPSWLYSVDQGATTIWERWDSYTREGGFHKHHWNMNSFNHYAYGVIAEWMYAYMGGIRPGAPGFRHVVLSPHADRRPAHHPTLQYQPRITWMRTKVHTPQGDITSVWRLMDDGHYEYEFTLPAGVTYSVNIPHLTNKDKVIIKQ